MQLNNSRDRAWLSARFECGISLAEQLRFGGAEKDAYEGSIKNWPSILRCCLGGVRGAGQIGFYGDRFTLMNERKRLGFAEKGAFILVYRGSETFRELFSPGVGKNLQALFLSISSGQLSASF